MQRRSSRFQSLTVMLVAPLALAVVGPRQAVGAIAPDDAAVQQATEKGVQFLLKGSSSVSFSTELGERCLVAIALVKCKVDPNHPMIRDAVASLKAQIKTGEITNGYHSVYNLGVGLVLLSALKDKDKETVQAALKQLLSFQRSSGGFASIGNANGDTSMTQYAVLGMWEAAQLGVYAPPQAWQGVCNWLMQTQTADGTFVYNPGLTNGSVSHSMTAAGLGSLYICANYIRSREQSKPRDPGKGEKKAGDEIPSALVPVGEKKKEAAKEKAPSAIGPIAIDKGKLEAAFSRGNGWLAKTFTVSISQWNLYYLYALERYFAFRESLERRPYEEIDWYGRGAAHLLSSQAASGGWRASDSTERVNTAFALLFLIQNTRKSLSSQPKVEEKAGGTLLSGSGLPADLSNIRVKDGRVSLKPLSGPAGEMLEIIQKPGDPRFEAAVEGLGELVMKADDIMLSPHLVMLKKLAKSGSPEARAVVVAALGKTRNLDVVPTLIYALQDDDEQVMRSAWEALRFTSRRYDTFGLSPNFTGDDKARAQAKAKAIEKWKAWYRSVRPDADFDE